ncbi:MAG: DUF502 domain-containing protein [Nitrospiria bacterium]
MERLKNFFKSAVLGGLLVVLPLALSVFILGWVFGLVRSAIAPITALVMKNSALHGLVVDMLGIAILVLVCFAVGVTVRTRLGYWFYSLLETNLLKKVPGYSLIKETVAQFLGNKRSPFSAVALAQIFGNETLVSAFITDEHKNGYITVFVPTGPNPTSGNIFHLPPQYVHPVDVPVEDAMRSIISCGAGSTVLIKEFSAKIKENASSG